MATTLSHEPVHRLRVLDAPEAAPAADAQPHVVILGGGFAGLNAAKALRKAPVRVTLIDKRNFHLFQPLLYQVATASLAPSEVAYPIRAILRRQRNATVLLGEVTGIDLDAREITMADGHVPYDYLIVATGSQTSYFGHDDWQAIAPGLKSMEEARILLVEGGPSLLKGYPDGLTASAQRSLERLGVEVRTGTRVLDIDSGRVRLPGEEIDAETILWAAGVTAHDLGSDLGGDPARAGRVPVTETLQLAGHPEVFVAGDLAASAGKDGEDLPGVAQVAMQGGKLAGKNVARLVAGKAPKPFRYFDKGTMATIGWNRAVAHIGPAKLSGFPAWAIWAFIHIAYLITYRSRLTVMLQWAWAYVTRGRGSRLITGLPVEEGRVRPDARDTVDTESRAA